MNERTAQMQRDCCHPKEIEASRPAPALCAGTSASCWVQERRRALLLQNPCQQKAQCFLPGYWTEQTEQMPRRGWDHVAGIKGEHTQGWNERKRLSPDGRKLSSSVVACLHPYQVIEGCVVLVLLLIGRHQHGGNMTRNQNISRTTHSLRHQLMSFPKGLVPRPNKHSQKVLSVSKSLWRWDDFYFSETKVSVKIKNYSCSLQAGKHCRNFNDAWPSLSLLRNN